MKMVTRKLSSQAQTSAKTCEDVGKLVLSNIIAYRYNYFGLAFMERLQQFPLADALHAAQDSWEAETQQTGALNG